MNPDADQRGKLAAGRTGKRRHGAGTPVRSLAPRPVARTPVKKDYGANGEYTLGKYERERIARRGQV